MSVAAKTLRPHLKAVSSRWKGVLYDFYPMNSPMRRRKKYAIIIMSHYAWRKGLPKVLSMLEMFWRTWVGTIFTWLGGGSCLL